MFAPTPNLYLLIFLLGTLTLLILGFMLRLSAIENESFQVPTLRNTVFKVLQAFNPMVKVLEDEVKRSASSK